MTKLTKLGSRGFTLVELIIVIAILGILAVGLLVAIDPIEQLAKARDSNRRRAAVEYLGGLSRYLAVQASYPWGVAGATTALTFNTINGTLVSAGELATKFTSQLVTTPYVGVNGLTVYAEAASVGKVRVCFSPESKGVKRDPQSKYSSDMNSTCDPAATDVCYFCAE